MLSSIYDPLGLVSPFSLKGRKTIQELYKGNFQWDHPIPENIKQQWIKWKSNLGKLNIIKIARCFKSKNFGHVKGYSVHHFSDASGIGYGQASYLQIANEDGKVHCCLLISKEAAKTLLQNFYVDDLLKSTKGAEEAVSLTKNVVQRCTAGGFKLTKFISNHPDVLSAIPEEDRKVGVKDQDLLTGKVPEERALGVLWNTDKDTLCCNINIMEKPLTRRGLLAMLSSIYDPLGLVSPFSLKGRKTIQELCKGSFQWDHPIPENIKQQWIKWKSNLGKLNIIKIARCSKSILVMSRVIASIIFQMHQVLGMGKQAICRLQMKMERYTAVFSLANLVSYH